MLYDKKMSSLRDKILEQHKEEQGKVEEKRKSGKITKEKYGKAKK